MNNHKKIYVKKPNVSKPPIKVKMEKPIAGIKKDDPKRVSGFEALAKNLGVELLNEGNGGEDIILITIIHWSYPTCRELP